MTIWRAYQSPGLAGILTALCDVDGIRSDSYALRLGIVLLSSVTLLKALESEICTFYTSLGS
jgi:hypothetical protein